MPGIARYAFFCLSAVAFSAAPARAQYGLLFSGSGPVNRAMGGASVATAADATGGLFWNPATISGLPRTEMDFSIELIDPHTHVASSTLFPVRAAGSDRGDDGVFPIPAASLVWRPDDCGPWTFGLGVFEVGGFGVNYPASLTNPVLAPQPPTASGLGAVYSELIPLEIAPSVSCQVTDRLAVGFGPQIELASLKVDPAFITTPDLVAPGVGRYPTGTHTRFEWGFGVQAGATYALDGGWHLGASVKSPRWFEDFGFTSTSAIGLPRHFTFEADLPLVASTGISYTGFERWLLETDFHYIDYANAEGLRQSGFDPAGAVRGLGWKSIYAIAFGAQYQLTDTLTVRAGYTYNDSPIDSAHSFFNIASPTITEHTVSVGFSYKLMDCLSLSASYAHAFEHSVTGPIVLPATNSPLPFSSVTNRASGESFVLGATVLLGPRTN
jgi:long-chain fatty acid transport protein